jgi:hypothetical protein
MAKSAHLAYVVANGQPALVAVLLPYWAALSMPHHHSLLAMEHSLAMLNRPVRTVRLHSIGPSQTWPEG